MRGDVTLMSAARFHERTLLPLRDIVWLDDCLVVKPRTPAR